MAQYTFARTERKYLLAASVYEAFKKDVEQYIDPDGKYPVYTLCNVYYDNETWELARRSVEKPIFKEKLRVRSYGTANPDTKVYIEAKSKYKGTVYKRRIGMPHSEVSPFLENKELPANASQIAKELHYFAHLFHLKPKVFLAYDRIAYVGRDDKSFRLTFDYNIRYRLDRLSLAEGDDGTPLITDGTVIMEVKAQSALPRFFLDLLAKYSIIPGSFSKYGKVYERSYNYNYTEDNTYARKHLQDVH